MKPSTPQLAALLNGPDADALLIADLVTIALTDGVTVLRLTTWTVSLTVSGNLFSADTLFPRVNGWSQRLKLSVDSLKLDLIAKTEGNGAPLTDGLPVLQAIAAGAFDDASVTLERLFMVNPGDVSFGTVVLFKGNVADITSVDRVMCELEVRSRLQLLNFPVPARVFQAACPWALYDARCTLSKSAFQTAGTVAAGPVPLLFNTNLTQADNYFNSGLITFLTGLNTGVTRTVRTYANASGETLLYQPLPNLPAAGDTFNIFPGCDKTMATCEGKFSNLINFGGQPYIPVPEQAL